jgi:4-amino-4-deoxy-L-arabinose transferase-like glycosyltransferase
MNTQLPALGWKGWGWCGLVLLVAGAVRAGYLWSCVDRGAAESPFPMQDRPRALGTPLARTDGQPITNEQDNLVTNLAQRHWFGGLAPLADQEEDTAHVAPGYPYLLAGAQLLLPEPHQGVRWLQALLGTLTVGCYFFFARRAFGSLAVAGVTGLLAAVYPFWVFNTADLGDGVVASFLLAAVLALGSRASQDARAGASLLFGLSLAGLVLVRAALVPFALAALLGFLWCCRRLKGGWLCAVVGFLSFAGCVSPWLVRHFRAFQEIVPIADTTWLYLWEGNLPGAQGGPVDEKVLRQSLPEALRQQLLEESVQPRRYARLAGLVWESIVQDPVGTLRRRLAAALSFWLGQLWSAPAAVAAPPPTAAVSPDALPAWLRRQHELLLLLPLLLLLTAGFFGWRWSYPWRRRAWLATLALVWVPVPYLLSHAEVLWGPRLPLDGVLLCLTAYTFLWCCPGVGGHLRAGPLPD